jgi:hypothetical protein
MVLERPSAMFLVIVVVDNSAVFGAQKLAYA